MNRALFLIAGWIGRALALKVASLKRPLAGETAVLHERLEKIRAENVLLRARLERLDPFRRPRFEPWQRLAILWHRARYAMSIEATAKAFVVTQTTYFPQIGITISNQGYGLFREGRSAPCGVAAF